MLPVGAASDAYAREVVAVLVAAGVQAEGDYRPLKLGAKIMYAMREKVSYMAFVGERDRAQRSVSLRTLAGVQHPPMSLVDLIHLCSSN